MVGWTSDRSCHSELKIRNTFRLDRESALAHRLRNSCQEFVRQWQRNQVKRKIHSCQIHENVAQRRHHGVKRAVPRLDHQVETRTIPFEQSNLNLLQFKINRINEKPGRLVLVCNQSVPTLFHPEVFRENRRNRHLSNDRAV